MRLVVREQRCPMAKNRIDARDRAEPPRCPNRARVRKTRRRGRHVSLHDAWSAVYDEKFCPSHDPITQNADGLRPLCPVPVLHRDFRLRPPKQRKNTAPPSTRRSRSPIASSASASSSHTRHRYLIVSAPSQSTFIPPNRRNTTHYQNSPVNNY